jgi:hypothetical protein
MKRLVNWAVDSGQFGLRALRTHIVVCGFPRSGSTLLQLQIETCVCATRSFREEYGAGLAAQFAFRNHPYMITKAPWDIFSLDEIRAFYATRPAQVIFIATVRDPRAVLTSINEGRPTNNADGYFVNPARWIHYYKHVRYAQQFHDVLTVEYTDLVGRPAEVETRLTERIGWEVRLPFDKFYTAASPKFDQRNLNGLRPLDLSRVNAWRKAKHRARICRVLREIPELPEWLIDMGYETDTSWVRDYL